MTLNSLKKALLSMMLIILTSLSAFSQQTLWVGQSYTFDVTSSVMGLTANMSWSTSGGYLSLSGSGLYRTITVTQYFSGTATVTCEWDYKLTGNGSYTHTKRQVTISCRDNQVSISPASMTLTPGESRYVSYRHQYDNQYTSAANAYFQSADPSICTVSSSGEVVAKNPGTTYINVYSKISSVSPYCRVTVEKVSPTSISIPSSLTMTGGETKKISPTIYPSNAQSNLSWESSNTLVAKVSNDGTISALQEGNSVITVRTDNGLSASCNLTVQKGKLTISSNTPTGWVEKGTKVSLSASQPNATIFYTVDGTDPSVSSDIYSSPIVVEKNLTIKAFAKYDGFFDSDVETFKYNIRDFVVQDISPSDDQAVNRYIIPRVSFNQSFKLSSECENIVFQDNGGNDIPYSLEIGENTLFICPKKELEDLKGYRVVIPENAIQNVQGENNKEISFNFNTGSRIIKISYGTENAAIIKSDGSLWVWGNSRAGQLGDGNSSDKIIDSPIKIMDNVIDVNMSYQRGLALKSDGSVWSWGRNDSGYIGNGNKQNQLTPVNILTGIKKIFCGESTSAAISDNGNLYMWGGNYYGQIGDGSNTTALSPKKILSNVNDVSVRYQHTVASVGSNNSIYAWGHNCHKEIFTYGSSGQSVEVKTPWKLNNYYGDIVASTEGNTIFLDNGTVTLCGINFNGIFGNGITDSYVAQGMLTPISNIKDIKSAQYYILALDNNNSLWGWGDNEYGQIGCGNYNDVSKPYKIIEDVEFFYAGYRTAAAILSNGDVYAWGLNKAGQLLGHEDSSTVSVPTKIFSGPSEFAIESVSLIYSNNFIAPDNTCVCVPIFNPIDASTLSIEWISSNEDIATVDNFGIVKGISDGVVNITATITGNDGNVWKTSTEITVFTTKSVNPITLPVKPGVFSAKLSAECYATDVDKFGFYLCENSDEAAGQYYWSQGEFSGSGYGLEVSTLKGNTEYVCQSVIEIDGVHFEGNEVVFLTKSILTTTPSNFTDAGASLNGEIGIEVSAAWFEFRADSWPSVIESERVDIADFNIGNVLANSPVLQLGETYRYRIAVENKGETLYGDWVEFKFEGENGSEEQSVGVIEYLGTCYDLYAPGKCKIVAPIDGSEYDGEVWAFSTIRYNDKTYIADNNVSAFQNSQIKHLICGFNPDDFSSDGGQYSMSLRYDEALEKITFLFSEIMMPMKYSANNINLGQNTGCVDVDIEESSQGYDLKINKFNLFGSDGEQLKPCLIVEGSGEVITPDENNTFHLDENLRINGEYCKVLKTSLYTVVYIYGETEIGTFANVRLEIPPFSGVENSMTTNDAAVTYYNIQGVKVESQNLCPGVYIRHQGQNYTKVLIP